MHHHHAFMLLPLLTGMAFADVLIDDFENGSTLNKFGWSWYYFSDVKDGGNSRIVNAEELGNGSYSAFKPDTGGYGSKKCAKVEFVLGDTVPRKSKEVYMNNFIGIGADIAQPGKFVDIRPSNGISFRARSNDSLIIFFELVTCTIYDFNYYRNYFIIDDTWRQFTVTFSDSINFHIPTYCINSPGSERYSLDLYKVQKINWQVVMAGGCLHMPENITEQAASCFQDSGSFFIDDVRFLGIDSMPGTARSTPVNFNYGKHPAPHASFFSVQYDLLGRLISPYGKIDPIPGVFIGEKESGLINRSIVDKKR